MILISIVDKLNQYVKCKLVLNIVLMEVRHGRIQLSSNQPRTNDDGHDTL